MTAAEIAATLENVPGRMPVVVNGRPVTAVEVAGGRIRRDMMDVSLVELPEKPRDMALVLRMDEGSGLTVDEVRKALLAEGGMDLFVWGEQVSSMTVLEASARGRGAKGKVASPMHWTELSDGTQDETHVWLEPAVMPEDREWKR